MGNCLNTQISKPVILEYIWVGGKGEFRSKYKTVNKEIDNKLSIPSWNYDGSSTAQAITTDSEINLVPVANYNNPFFSEGEAKLVFCEAYNRDGTPVATNHRDGAFKIFNKNLNQKPWYGLEQEYWIMAPNGTYPSTKTLLHSLETVPESQDAQGYYCGVGNQHIKGIVREIVEQHLEYCIRAGLTISGANMEVAPSQAEFQIGPCVGIDAGDQLMVARYILHKLSEKFNVNISFEPKLDDDFNGSGLHTNFSTEETRGSSGLNFIKGYLQKMGAPEKHQEHLAVYGDNSRRLTGAHETSNPETFSFKEGSRGASVRIPWSVIEAKSGYFEDRRPASDADPYLIISKIFETCCL